MSHSLGWILIEIRDSVHYSIPSCQVDQPIISYKVRKNIKVKAAMIP